MAKPQTDSDVDILQKWIRDFGEAARRQAPAPIWDGKFITQAIRLTSSSAPGPDGIPFDAYKHCCVSSPILQDIGQYLFEQGELSTLLVDFNPSILTCLPEKNNRRNSPHLRGLLHVREHAPPFYC